MTAALFALMSAALFGLASALQHQQARAVPTSTRPSLLLTLAQRPLWLAGIGADAGAVTCQVVALRYGSVELVQTLLVAGLPLAAVLSAALHRRRLWRHEVGGIAACTAGLALVGPALSSSPVGRDPSRTSAVIAAVVVAAGVVPCLALRGRPRFGPALAGVAAGTVIGAASVLLAVAASRFGSWPAFFGSVAPYAAAAAGALGLLLAQVAFQTGELGAPLAALSLAEPVVAVAVAVTVLGEHLPTGPATSTTAVAGAVLAVAGVFALSRESRPALAGQRS